MKRLWAALALLFFLLALSLFNAACSQLLADDLTKRLGQAQELAEQGRWEQARELTLQIYDRWEDSHYYLHTFLRHSDTDGILRAFQAVLEYLKLKELDQYTAANTDLILQISLLAEMEQVSLVNIL